MHVIPELCEGDAGIDPAEWPVIAKKPKDAHDLHLILVSAVQRLRSGPILVDFCKQKLGIGA